MLHKTESLIVADTILRMVRLDKRLKHITGSIKPYILNVEHGYTIEITRSDSSYTISFALDQDGYIVVYLDDSALAILDNDFEKRKLFKANCYLHAKEYILNAILNNCNKTKKTSAV